MVSAAALALEGSVALVVRFHLQPVHIFCSLNIGCLAMPVEHYDSHLALVGVGSRWFSVGAGQCGVGHQRRCDGTPWNI